MSFLVAAFVFYVFATLGVCISALVWGGRDERAVAIGFLVTTLTSSVVSLIENERYRHPQYGVMAVDVCFLVFLLVIVRRTRRFWPLWAAAAHLVGTLTHLTKILEPSTVMQAYATAQPFWAFPVLAALAVGTFHNRRTAA